MQIAAMSFPILSSPAWPYGRIFQGTVPVAYTPALFALQIVQIRIEQKKQIKNRARTARPPQPNLRIQHRLF